MFSRHPGPRLGQLVWSGAAIQPPPPIIPSPVPQQPGVTGTTATVRVLDPDRRPVVGAKTTVYAVPVDGSRYGVKEGVTNSKGEWVFTREAVSPQVAYRYDLVVSGGNFPRAEIIIIPGRVSKKTVIVCLHGLDPLICEVAEKQEVYRTVYAENMVIWGHGGFAARMAHAAVRNVPVKDSRLQPYFMRISWGMGDLSIPASDWPELLKYYHQTKKVLDRVPWPKFTGAAEKITEYFRACSESRIPVGVDKDGMPLVIRDFRLYSPTWSDFFPKSDLELRRAFATAWAANMTSISACVNHRIRKKARGAERTMKMMSIAAMASVLFLAGPLGLGPPGVAAVFVGQAVQHVRLRTGEDFSENLGANLPKLSEDLLQPGLSAEGATVVIVTALLVHYIDNSDLSPEAKAAAKFAVPKIADKVVQDNLTAEVVVPEYILVQQAISAVLVTLVANAIRTEGIKEAKKVGRIVLGYRRQAEAAMIPFQIWIYRTLLVGDIIEKGAKEAGIDFDAERDLYAVAEEEAAGAGVDIPADATNPESADTPGPVATSTIGGVAAAGAGLLILGIAASTLT